MDESLVRDSNRPFLLQDRIKLYEQYPVSQTQHILQKARTPRGPRPRNPGGKKPKNVSTYGYRTARTRSSRGPRARPPAYKEKGAFVGFETLKGNAWKVRPTYETIAATRTGPAQDKGRTDFFVSQPSLQRVTHRDEQTNAKSFTLPSSAVNLPLADHVEEVNRILALKTGDIQQLYRQKRQTATQYAEAQMEQVLWQRKKQLTKQVDEYTDKFSKITDMFNEVKANKHLCRQLDDQLQALEEEREYAERTYEQAIRDTQEEAELGVEQPQQQQTKKKNKNKRHVAFAGSIPMATNAHTTSSTMQPIQKKLNRMKAALSHKERELDGLQSELTQVVHILEDVEPKLLQQGLEAEEIKQGELRAELEQLRKQHQTDLKTLRAQIKAKKASRSSDQAQQEALRMELGGIELKFLEQQKALTVAKDRVMHAQGLYNENIKTSVSAYHKLDAAMKEAVQPLKNAHLTALASVSSLEMICRTLEQDLTCVKCFEILTDPVLFHPCGHSLCLKCMPKATSSSISSSSTAVAVSTDDTPSCPECMLERQTTTDLEYKLRVNYPNPLFVASADFHNFRHETNERLRTFVVSFPTLSHRMEHLCNKFKQQQNNGKEFQWPELTPAEVAASIHPTAHQLDCQNFKSFLEGKFQHQQQQSSPKHEQQQQQQQQKSALFELKPEEDQKKYAEIWTEVQNQTMRFAVASQLVRGLKAQEELALALQSPLFKKNKALKIFTKSSSKKAHRRPISKKQRNDAVDRKLKLQTEIHELKDRLKHTALSKADTRAKLKLRLSDLSARMRAERELDTSHLSSHIK